MTHYSTDPRQMDLFDGPQPQLQPRPRSYQPPDLQPQPGAQAKADLRSYARALQQAAERRRGLRDDGV